MSVETLLILLLISVGFGVIFFLIKQQGEKKQNPEEMEKLINQIFGMSAQKIAAQSRDILKSEKEAIGVDLKNKQQAIEKLVKSLQEDIKTRQDEIRGLERDRNKKFSEISTAITEHKEMTKELQASTQALAKVLSNNQTRGAWGERIIEDLLESNGLVEGVHYRKQSKLGQTALKPDITLLLPEERVVAVDVKFPYSELQKMTVAETKSAKQEHFKQFAVDLKNKIKKVAEYINPEENTLDYAILFVPNETVFSVINKQLPDIVDDAMTKRVIIVSPFTFLVVARTVIESYRNFMMEKNLKKIISHISDFGNEWEKFKEEFLKFGRSIDTLKTGFEKLSTTRTKQMERKLGRIEEYKLSDSVIPD